MTPEALYNAARTQWVPRWFDLFYDPATGGFHERLEGGKPTGHPRRLVTQCRQIMVYATANDARYTPAIDRAFAYIEASFSAGTPGAYVFAENDRHIDLYALAFLIAACAAAGRHALAITVLDFIETHFTQATGFAEKLDLDLNLIPQKRRQNPHMHLLEAVQSMAVVSDNPRYKAMAEQLLDLFLSRFYTGGFLYEFFDETLENPDDWIEAGHHAEWVWLLHRFAKQLGMKSARIPAVKHLLYEQARKGWDDTHGGIYNVQNTSGTPLDDNKRIWPQMEMLRAARIMGDVNMEKSLLTLLQQRYLQQNGDWVEGWNRDFSAAQGHMPGTTPYHIYPLLFTMLESFPPAP